MSIYTLATRKWVPSTDMVQLYLEPPRYYLRYRLSSMAVTTKRCPCRSGLKTRNCCCQKQAVHLTSSCLPQSLILAFFDFHATSPSPTRNVKLSRYFSLALSLVFCLRLSLPLSVSQNQALSPKPSTPKPQTQKPRPLRSSTTTAPGEC